MRQEFVKWNLPDDAAYAFNATETSERAGPLADWFEQFSKVNIVGIAVLISKRENSEHCLCWSAQVIVNVSSVEHRFDRGVRTV